MDNIIPILKSDLIDANIKAQKRMTELENEHNFHDRLYLAGHNPEENFYACEAIKEQKLEHEQYIQQLNDQYDKLFKEITHSNTYALTIGSAEREDIKPVLQLYNRFKDSSINSDSEFEGYFEKGENGYIHIHAIITRKSRYVLSFANIKKRYGKYQQKQHNFDIKPLKGLEVTKWKQYIKKDSMEPWNANVNKKLV